MKFRTLRGFAGVILAASLMGPLPAQAQDDQAGKGSIGFAMGAMRFTGGDDLTEDVGIRPIFRLTFKYAWEEHLVTVLETAYGWNAYGEGGGYTGPDSVGTLGVVTPLTLGLDYRFSINSERVVPRFGAGFGSYTVAIRSGRKQASRDPVTDQKRTKTALGFYGKVGTEVLLLPTMALNADVLWHNALTKDEENFPRGFFDTGTSFAELRVGINYYFTIKSTGAAPAVPSDDDEDEE